MDTPGMTGTPADRHPFSEGRPSPLDCPHTYTTIRPGTAGARRLVCMDCESIIATYKPRQIATADQVIAGFAIVAILVIVAMVAGKRAGFF